MKKTKRDVVAALGATPRLDIANRCMTCANETLAEILDEMIDAMLDGSADKRTSFAQMVRAIKANADEWGIDADALPVRLSISRHCRMCRPDKWRAVLYLRENPA